MTEFMTKTIQENQARRSNPEKIADEFDLLDGEQAKARVEKNSHLSVQLLKLRQDVDSLKSVTQRFSSTNFLQMMQENNEAMNKKIEEKYGKLTKEIHDVT